MGTTGFQVALRKEEGRHEALGDAVLSGDELRAVCSFGLTKLKPAAEGLLWKIMLR